MAVAPNLAAAFVLAVPLGMGGAGYIASTNGILLPRVRADMRGRVLALQATAFLGSTPIGGPITGWIGDHFGASWSIAYGGLIVARLRGGGRRLHREPAAVAGHGGGHGVRSRTSPGRAPWRPSPCRERDRRWCGSDATCASPTIPH